MRGGAIVRGNLFLVCLHWGQSTGTNRWPGGNVRHSSYPCTIQRRFAVLPECADLQLLQGARWLVSQQTASPAPAGAAAPAAPRAAPAHADGPQGSARPRNTRVVLPRTAESEVPSWFFEKTGAEIKAAFLNAVKRREESQVSNWKL